MVVYIIRGEAVTAYRSVPNLLSEGDIVVGSAEEIAASGLTLARMVAIWNALPGITTVTKFQDRKRAVQRLWAAFTQLPVEAEPVATCVNPRAGSKQAKVVGLLQRPEGATIDEMAAKMGWQRHTLRGLISGALKKRLGLQVISEKTARGRRYRIATKQPVT